MYLCLARSGETRGEHQYCRFISAFVKTSPFALNEPYYGNSASVKLLTPTRTAGTLSLRPPGALMQSGKMGTGTRKQG